MIRLSFNSAKYRRILFGSDFHYDHQRDFVYEPRGFKTPQEHSAFLEKEVQSLHPEDLVFLLGDQALNSTPDRVRDLMEMFPCETYIINGNHNAGIKQLYDAALSRIGIPKGIEYHPIKIATNVTHLGEAFELDIDRNRFYCRHFAALIWDECNKGRDHLCGHSHGQFTELNPGKSGLGKILDVGVENAIKHNGSAFFTLQQVIDLLAAKPRKTWDHH